MKATSKAQRLEDSKKNEEIKLLNELAGDLASALQTLFISGYAHNAIVHDGVLDPDIPFLQKPFTMESLAWKVREILQKEQA